MQYYSTNHQSSKVSFKEAMLRSEAADGGLYMPEKLPLLPKAFLKNMAWMSLKDVAYVINNTIFGADLPSNVIKQITDDAATYSMPLYEIEKGIYVMELFHGPTKTVKDFGAQVMTRIIHQLLHDRKSALNVLVATTGNSGNAIASAFHEINGVNVFVLYPKGVAKNHIDHINSLGDNIHSIEVNGSIDDCVSMMIKAFKDPELNENMLITSANSMNLGSLMPSTVPYFHAYSQLCQKGEDKKDLYISVPCGNGGNLLAGYIAKKMGLPVHRLIGACNINAGIHKYLTEGINDKKAPSQATYSYGMDRPYSANLPRFKELCGHDIDQLRRDVASEVVTDHETARVINDVYAHSGYLLDPHAAVAYAALKRNLPKGACGLVMATSHPVNSVETLEAINEGALKLPFHNKHKNYCNRPEAVIPPTYGALKKYLDYVSRSIGMLDRS